MINILNWLKPNHFILAKGFVAERKKFFEASYDLKIP
jgi:hypothetical protein